MHESSRWSERHTGHQSCLTVASIELNGRPAVSFGDMWVMTWRNWLMIDCEGGAEGEHKQTKKNCLALEHMGFYTLFFLFTAQPRSTTFAIRTGTHTPTMHNRRICIQFFIGLFFMPLEQNAFFFQQKLLWFFLCLNKRFDTALTSYEIIISKNK